MPLRTGRRHRPAGGAGQGLPLDAQFRSAAPGHAHHAAPHPHARRRNGRQGRARHRLPAQRLREARRASRLQPVRHHRRSDELHLAGRQRDRLASRRREADGHRADAALQVHPHDLRRADAHPRPSALRAGPRRSTSAASRRSSTPSTSARRSTTSARRRRASASTRATRASAACCATSTTTGSPRSAPSSRTSPRPTPTWCRLLNRNRIFIDRHQGHRRPVARRTPSTSAAPARSPGPAASSATCARTSRTWPTRTSTSRWSAPTAATASPATWCAWRRCWRASRSSSRPSRTCRPGRSTSTSTARSCCPTRCRSIAASRG